MEREILIDAQEAQERRVAVVEDKSLEEYYIERPGAKCQIGHIYKGTVTNVLAGIQAAFVDIGLEKNGFLHIDDVETRLAETGEEDNGKERPAAAAPAERNIANLLKEGQEIITQVIKEPLGTKGVRLTTSISIPGRFLVLLPFEKQISVSRKIMEPEERKRLRQLANALDLPEGCGLIVRTAGEGCTPKEFNNDAQYLLHLWSTISAKHASATVPALLHEELDLVLRTIRDSYTDNVARIVVNAREEYQRVLDFVRRLVPDARREVQLYENKVPLFTKWGVQKDIDRAFRRKVWLKCGGYIVIDEAEAMIAIDVNSGRHVSSENLEDTVTKTNLEAADEVARQLRLRNVGGLVVIDFIDMRSRQNQREVLARLQAALKKDKAKNSILPISEFGLVEMTRQRMKESISDSVYDTCPYCKGRGAVKSLVSACIDVQRAIKSVLMQRPERDLRIEVQPMVMEQMRDNIVLLRNLEEKYHAQLTICCNAKFHIEDFTVYDHRNGKILETTR